MLNNIKYYVKYHNNTKIKIVQSLCIAAVVNLFAVSNFVTVYSKLNFEATSGAKLQMDLNHLISMVSCNQYLSFVLFYLNEPNQAHFSSYFNIKLRRPSLRVWT